MKHIPMYITFWKVPPKKTNETCTFHLLWHHPWGAWDFGDCSPSRNGHEKSRVQGGGGNLAPVPLGDSL